MHFRQSLITAFRLTPLKATHESPDPEVPPLFVSGLRMHVVEDHVPGHLGGGRNYRLYAADPGPGPEDAGARRVLERLDVTPWWGHHPGHRLEAWSPGCAPSGVVWSLLTLGVVRLARPGAPYVELPDDPDRVPRTLVLSLLAARPLEGILKELRVDPVGPGLTLPGALGCGDEHEEVTA
jgi:hypothetical protein